MIDPHENEVIATAVAVIKDVEQDTTLIGVHGDRVHVDIWEDSHPVPVEAAKSRGASLSPWAARKLAKALKQAANIAEANAQS